MVTKAFKFVRTTKAMLYISNTLTRYVQQCTQLYIIVHICTMYVSLVCYNCSDRDYGIQLYKLEYVYLMLVLFVRSSNSWF